MFPIPDSAKRREVVPGEQRALRGKLRGAVFQRCSVVEFNVTLVVQIHIGGGAPEDQLGIEHTEAEKHKTCLKSWQAA